MTARMSAERYLAMWNEPDPERRRSLVEEGWTASGHYVDPLDEATGPDAIASLIGGVRGMFPAHAFVLAGEPDMHGAHLRFSWRLCDDAGQRVAGGTDVARLDGAGRFVSVVGFLDAGPGTDVPAFVIGRLHDVRVGPPIVRYLEAIDATLEPFGGRFRIHGDRPEVLEGEWTGDLIALEFPDRRRAEEWYRSDAYAALLPLRRDNAEGAVILIDGVADSHRATDILARL